MALPIQALVRCRTVGSVIDRVRSLRVLTISGTRCFPKDTPDARAALLARVPRLRSELQPVFAVDGSEVALEARVRALA